MSVVNPIKIFAGSGSQELAEKIFAEISSADRSVDSNIYKMAAGDVSEVSGDVSGIEKFTPADDITILVMLISENRKSAEK